MQGFKAPGLSSLVHECTFCLLVSSCHAIISRASTSVVELIPRTGFVLQWTRTPEDRLTKRPLNYARTSFHSTFAMNSFSRRLKNQFVNILKKKKEKKLSLSTLSRFRVCSGNGIPHPRKYRYVSRCTIYEDVCSTVINFMGLSTIGLVQLNVARSKGFFRATFDCDHVCGGRSES